MSRAEGEKEQCHIEKCQDTEQVTNSNTVTGQETDYTVESKKTSICQSRSRQRKNTAHNHCSQTAGDVYELNDSNELQTKCMENNSDSQQHRAQMIELESDHSSSPTCNDDDDLPALLLGTYTPKLDAKGRIALPAKLRALLGAGVVMTRGQEHCVYLLPRKEFRKIAVQIQRTSLGNRAAREYLRIFLSGATDETFDKQGRVMVPQALKQYASLTSEVVVIGVGTRAEVWDKTMWEEYLTQKEQDYADIAEDVLPAMDW